MIDGLHFNNEIIQSKSLNLKLINIPLIKEEMMNLFSGFWKSMMTEKENNMQISSYQFNE